MYFSYCAQECHRKEVDIETTMIPFDLSWLRIMCHHIGVDGKISYGFADDGYVRRFATQLGNNCIAVWSIRSCRHHRLEQVIYWAQQCHDCEGPKMASDKFSHECASIMSKPQEALAAVNNSPLLAYSNIAKAN